MTAAKAKADNPDHLTELDPNEIETSRTRRRDRGPLFSLGKTITAISFVEHSLSSKKGTPRLSFTLTALTGPSKGQTIRHDCYLVKGALWKLGDTILAARTRDGKDGAQARVDALKASNGTLVFADVLQMNELFADCLLVANVVKEEYEDPETGNPVEGRRVAGIQSTDASVNAILQAALNKRLDRPETDFEGGGAEDAVDELDLTGDIPF